MQFEEMLSLAWGHTQAGLSRPRSSAPIILGTISNRTASALLRGRRGQGKARITAGRAVRPDMVVTADRHPKNAAEPIPGFTWLGRPQRPFSPRPVGCGQEGHSFSMLPQIRSRCRPAGSMALGKPRKWLSNDAS